MRVAVDAFGGDNAPFEIVKGASMASNEYKTEITLTGKKREIEDIISKNGFQFFGELKIVDTDDVISMHDEPTSILKAHSQSSMALAFKELAEDRADAFVSAGSTGAIVVGGTLIIKRIKGVKRPALASMVPAPIKPYMLMDMGANADCRPEMLCQFGIMASVYLENVEGRENPEIALLNIGIEDTKGGEMQKQAYELLKKAPIIFVGNIEAREMPTGCRDAVITDGFTGNVTVKLIEGTAKTLFKELKKVFLKNIFTKIATLILKPGIKNVKAMLDSSEVGGAPLLGVRKPVIKAHGSSDAKAIKNAVRQAVTFAEKDVIGKISQSLAADTTEE